MPEKPSQPTERIGRRLILRGRVQGLGVRPTIVHVAQSRGLAGTVTNTNRGVEIEIEGDAFAVAEFTAQLPARLPAGSEVRELVSEPIPVRGRTGFRIIRQAPMEPPAARLPEDMAICSECLADIANRNERRYNYPFTSCTACGPRYTMIREMPYERPETTMGDFPLCEPCTREYTTPGDRRFHAQSTACPWCGPSIWTVDPQDPMAMPTLPGRPDPAGNRAAIETVLTALRAGQIVAMRGLGGYQLLVDATDTVAVDRLRCRKRRPAKPLALLVASMDNAKQIAHVSREEATVLASRRNPIVLLKAKSEPKVTLAAGIHPGLDTIGIMLPTTPLHTLISQNFGRPLVCTSANLEGEPLEFEVDTAQERLAGICDLWLHHNRPIARPIDDSVVRVIAGRPVTFRLARGFAPWPLDLPARQPILAVGGHLKGAVAWSNGAQAVLGPHVGDQEGLGNRERLIDTIQDAEQLYRFDPELLAHDAHPDYFTTVWAQEQSKETKPVPTNPSCTQEPRRACPGPHTNRPARISIHHHHAHAVAGMLEHGWLDRTVLAVTWDGTGYGADGTIWGGEFLAATATDFERVGTIRPFCLPGGEMAIREPWRITAALLQAIGQEEFLKTWLGDAVPPATRQAVLAICQHHALAPRTTSAGRLFDAVATLVLGKFQSAFDGQLAMELEAAADPNATGYYAFPVRAGTMQELNWQPLLEALLTDYRRGVSPGWMAMRFHRGLAIGIVAVCRSWPDWPVVLAGGVFQNRLLTELVLDHAADDGRPWGPPGTIPPGDGGLAAGQLAIATMRWVT